MTRTLTIRTAAAALALASGAASIGNAQYRAKQASTSNFYVGLAAGASMPSGQFRNAYRDGWSATVPIGWRPANGPLGMRLDIAYSKWGGATVGGVKLASAAVWDGMLDATVDMPFGANKTSSFYLVGGGGLHYFPKYGGESYSVAATPGDTTTTTPPVPPGPYGQVNSVVAIEDRSSTTRFGLNGGAGLSFGLRQGSALFLETRYVTVFTKDERTNYWPLVGGIRWTIR